jgi:hypothetical protein
MTRESEFDSQKGKTFFFFATTQWKPVTLSYGGENDHSYLSNAEVTKALPGVYRVRCLIKQMNNFKVAVAQSMRI